MWEHIPQSHQNGSALTYDHVGIDPTVTSEWISALGWVFLVTDQVPPFSQRMAFSTYIWSCGNTSHNHIRIFMHWSCGNTTHNHIRVSLHLHLTMWSSSFHRVRREQHLYLTMGGTHPTTMSERINAYIWPWQAWPTTISKGLTDSSLPLGGNLNVENTKLLPEVLKLHSSNF